MTCLGIQRDLEALVGTQIVPHLLAHKDNYGSDLSNLSDGTYGRELGRISPEGNMYGATRWVRDVLSNFWWNGAEWLEIGWDIGQSASVSLLPTTTQDPDTVWRCLDRVENGSYIWKYFFWDAQTQGWLPIEWYWTVNLDRL